MSRARLFVGLGSIVLLAIGVNIMVLREQLFVAPVFVPLVAGAALGIAWVVMRAAPSVLDREKTSGQAVNSVVASILFLAICITAYAIVKRADLSWDLTNEGRRELAPQTKLVLQSLTNDVEIVCFFIRSGDERANVAQDKTRRFLERCRLYTDRLSVEFVDPQANPERMQAMNAIRVSNVGTVVLRSGARQREIPISEVNARLEERHFTNALLNVTRNSIPKAYFLMGHGERDITKTDPKDGGSSFKLWLEKEAYEAAQCVIPADNPSLPPDCDVLIVNGYASDLLEHEIRALDQFIDDGGRLLVLVNVQVVQNQGPEVVEKMRPWLHTRFGINVGSDIIASKATNSYKIMLIPDFSVLSDYAPVAGTEGPFRGSFHAAHPITRTLDSQMLLGVVRSVSLDEQLPEGVSGDAIIRSTPDTWAETGLQDVVDGKSINQDPDEAPGPNPIAVAVRARSDVSIDDGDQMLDARIVVIGDADLSSNEAINLVGNQSLLLNAMAWLTESEDLIAIRPTGDEQQAMILSKRQQRVVAWIASLAAFQIVVAAGVIGYFMQRRNQ